MHVAAAERRQETNAVVEVAQGTGAAHRDRGRVGERRAEHDDDGSGTARSGPCDRVERVGGERLARHGADDLGCVSRERVRDRREIDERDAELERGAAHPQVQHRERVFEVGAEQHDGGRTVAVGDLARGSPSINSAGSPSPICASTLSVPITPFINRANA